MTTRAFAQSTVMGRLTASLSDLMILNASDSETAPSTMSPTLSVPTISRIEWSCVDVGGSSVTSRTIPRPLSCRLSSSFLSSSRTDFDEGDLDVLNISSDVC